MNNFYDRLIEITSVLDGENYEWAEWHAYYDPATRKYFAGSDAGCSCNDYEIEYAVNESEGLHSKQDVLRSLKAWVGVYRDDDSMQRQYENARRAIHLWTPPKGEQA